MKPCNFQVSDRTGQAQTTTIAKLRFNRSLVTGASGFIGSYLVDQLLASDFCDQEPTVNCLMSRRWATKGLKPKPRCDYFFGDITDPVSIAEAIQNVDVIFHLAASTRSHANRIFQVNHDGTRNLLAAAAKLDHPPVFVFISSLAAAGPVIGGQPRKESQPLSPVSNYGKSKRAAEMACQDFADQVPISILRPPIVFGPNDPNSFQLFAPIAKRGIHPMPGYRNPLCSMIHVRDLVSAMIDVAHKGQRLRRQDVDYSDRKSAEGIYFVADEQVVSYRELGKMIGWSVGREKVFNLYVPFPLIRAAGFIGQLSGLLTGKLPYLNADKTKEITAGSWACSPASLGNDTGFKPEYGLQERLRQTAEWYFENSWLQRASSNKPNKPYPGPRNLAGG